VAGVPLHEDLPRLSLEMLLGLVEVVQRIDPDLPSVTLGSEVENVLSKDAFRYWNWRTRSGKGPRPKDPHFLDECYLNGSHYSALTLTQSVDTVHDARSTTDSPGRKMPGPPFAVPPTPMSPRATIPEVNGMLKPHR